MPAASRAGKRKHNSAGGPSAAKRGRTERGCRARGESACCEISSMRASRSASGYDATGTVQRRASCDGHFDVLWNDGGTTTMTSRRSPHTPRPRSGPRRRRRSPHTPRPRSGPRRRRRSPHTPRPRAPRPSVPRRRGHFRHLGRRGRRRVRVRGERGAAPVRSADGSFAERSRSTRGATIDVPDKKARARARARSSAPTRRGASRGRCRRTSAAAGAHGGRAAAAAAAAAAARARARAADGAFRARAARQLRLVVGR